MAKFKMFLSLWEEDSTETVNNQKAMMNSHRNLTRTTTRSGLENEKIISETVK